MQRSSLMTTVFWLTLTAMPAHATESVPQVSSSKWQEPKSKADLPAPVRLRRAPLLPRKDQISHLPRARTNRPVHVESAPLREGLDKTKLEFKDTPITGERVIPEPIAVIQPGSDERMDLINLRVRWHPEMVQSAGLVTP